MGTNTEEIVRIAREIDKKRNELEELEKQLVQIVSGKGKVAATKPAPKPEPPVRTQDLNHTEASILEFMNKSTELRLSTRAISAGVGMGWHLVARSMQRLVEARMIVNVAEGKTNSSWMLYSKWILNIRSGEANPKVKAKRTRTPVDNARMQKVKLAVRDYGAPISASEVAKLCDDAPSTVRLILDDLVQVGGLKRAVVKKVGNRNYYTYTF